MYSSKVHLLCFSLTSYLRLACVLLPYPFLVPCYDLPSTFERPCYDRTKNPSQTSVRKGFRVPRPGLEPGWVAPLVFETSASTDSAIWALAGAKVRISEQKTKYFWNYF